METCRTLLMALPCAGMLMAFHGIASRAGHMDPSVGQEAIAVRVENLAVLPQSQPVLAVHVRNLRDVPFAGVIRPIVPEGWRLTPAERSVQLAPGATQRLTYSVEGGRESPGNRYPIEISISSDAGQFVVQHSICVATAPYAKPVIDGDPSDWQDTIPAEMMTGGKKTTIRTCWNRKAFSVLVAVEEDTQSLPGSGSPFDAVQFSLAARDSTSKTSEADTADRFEYLLVPGGIAPARCYALARPATRLADTLQPRSLEELIDGEVEVVVRRADKTTYYECSVPWREMKQVLQPAEGREIYFSWLVHDPDGTGLRDWGDSAGAWESQRTWFGWSKWPGAKWPAQPPHDSRIEWGLCSSRF